MTLNFILLEDGSGHILLEDSSGSILLENQPGSSSIVFAPTGNALRGSARTSMSSSLVFNVIGHALRGNSRTLGISSIVFTSVSNMKAFARTFGSSSIIFTVTGSPLHGISRISSGSSSILFTILGDLCFFAQPFNLNNSVSVSPVLSNTTSLDSLPAKVSSISPNSTYSSNTSGPNTLFAISTDIAPYPPFPENVNC